MKNFPIKPIGDRVIIKPDPAESVTPGGIIVPESAKEHPQFGTVIAIGKGRSIDSYVITLLLLICKKLDIKCEEIEPVPCKVGDRVMYGRYAGNEIEQDKEKYLVMRVSEIAATIEE